MKPILEFLFRAAVNIGPASQVSKIPAGERRFIPITGGSFKGQRLSGEVLPGGADWQLIRPDGSAILHARYTLRTKDESLIYVENKGIRRGDPDVLAQLARGEAVDPSRYYFRTVPQFETGVSKYAWLNNIISVCSGMRLVDSVIIDFYQVF
ncbi:MAG: DUF3237 domain-containing protein [Dehalococcoidales bacterium]|nr:DUF3237 domain-containing protein [Dehalococcoidales bacterium]